ncbi:unnamed protein product [Chironomus riparius]|uniref:Sialin n=1 Tax=Chironomus riparius TaxID=315576 RepID=A0A9N9WRH6_9DIPT|nr:unnamed protein product [Chironomus riparius]
MPIEVKDDKGNVITESLPIWKKRRYLLVMLVFFGFINIYTLRINLSVGIVAMTENKLIVHENGTEEWYKEFDWNTKQQGLVLSSFFYGYICTQFIGGIIAAKIGGHIILGLGIFITAVLTLLSPIAARTGIGAFVALRVLMGLAEGFTFPCMHQIWSKWAPPLERSRMAAIQYAGTFIGMVISLSTCGILADTYGWESVFYVYGIVGCIWYVFWLAIARASPANDRFISDEEKRYIEACLAQTKSTPTAKNIPYKDIFTSAAVWAIAASHFAENWGVYTMLTQLPLFFKHNLEFDLSGSGFIAAVPYLVLGIMLFLVGYLADWFQERKILTTSQVRRYFNCLAFVSQTTFMMLAAYQQNRVLIIVFITFGASLGALSICGYGVNHLDIAPQYASVLMGISNTVATIPGIISPLIAGFIVTEQTNASQWKWIFILTSCVYCCGCLIYWFFASGELQPWAKEKTEEIVEKKINESSSETEVTRF